MQRKADIANKTPVYATDWEYTPLLATYGPDNVVGAVRNVSVITMVGNYTAFEEVCNNTIKIKKTPIESSLITLHSLPSTWFLPGVDSSGDSSKQPVR